MVLRAIVCVPIEFLVKKLPLRYRRVLWPYLSDTLEIFLKPLQVSIDLLAFVVKLLLTGRVGQLTSLGLY